MIIDARNDREERFCFSLLTGAAIGRSREEFGAKCVSSGRTSLVPEGAPRSGVPREIDSCHLSLGRVL